MTVIAIFEDQPGGLADLERQFRRNHPVGPAADTVGSEITTTHETIPRRLHYGFVPLINRLLRGGQACPTAA